MKFSSFISAIGGTVLAALVLAATVPASAQEGPPGYARPDEVIHGVVDTFNQYDLTVKDDRGYIDRVHLHDGTIIRPRGFTLAHGVTVTIHGQASGSVFEAAEIDTPYHYRYAYAYPGPYAYYPYPGWRYGYPYGPAYSLGFGFRFR